MAKKRKPEPFDRGAEVRGMARERIGAVPPSRVVVEKKKDGAPKHKKKALKDNLEGN